MHSWVLSFKTLLIYNFIFSPISWYQIKDLEPDRKSRTFNGTDAVIRIISTCQLYCSIQNSKKTNEANKEYLMLLTDSAYDKVLGINKNWCHFYWLPNVIEQQSKSEEDNFKLKATQLS